MARRRGNKKRRDIARDSTGFRRVAKIGVVAAGVIAGGSAIVRSEIGRRVIKSGLSEATLKAGKGFKKDLLNKPKNLYTLKEAYERNVGKGAEIIKRDMAKKEIGKVNSAKIVDDIVKAKQTKDITLRRMRLAEDKGKMKLKEALTEKLDDVQKVKINDVVDALYHKVTEENIENKTILSHYKKIEKLGYSDEQVTGLLNTMLKWKQENPVDNQTVIDKYGALAEDIQNRRLNSLKNDTGGFFDRIINELTDTQPLRVKDLKDFENLDFGSRMTRDFQGSDKFLDLNREVRNLGKLGKEYGDVIIDRGLRVTTDEFGNKTLLDKREIVDSMRKFAENVQDTLPGKVLLKNFDTGTKHSFGVLQPDKFDVNAYLTGSENNIMKEAMIYLDGMLYGLKEDANGIFSLDESNTTEVREVTGWRKKVVQELLGTQQQPREAYDGPIAKLFDINQDGSYNIKKNTERFIDSKISDKFGLSADPDWERNQLKVMKKFVNDGELPPALVSKDATDEEIRLALTSVKSNMYDSAVTTSAILNRDITGVSDEVIDNLIKSGKLSEKQNRMLNYLLDGDKESINSFIYELGLDPKDVQNSKLSSMLNGVYKDIEAAEDINHISMKQGRHNPLFGMALDEQWERDEVGQFRVEYVKDLLLKQNDTGSYMDLIESVAQTDNQAKTLKSIGMLGLFEESMNIKDPIAEDVMSKFEPFGTEDRFVGILKSDSRLLDSFNEIMDDSIKSFSSFNKPYLGGINETGLYNEYNDLTLIRRSQLSPRNIIKNINEAIEQQSLSKAVDPLKEITTAGRFDTEHITEATLLTQYSMSRLNYSLAEFGLNLSSDSMSSPLSTYLNFGLKRVLPVAAGVTAFSYLNDESRRFTGSSIVEAGARGLSYLDIGAHKLAYATGVGHVLNNWAESSVIHEYYFGSNKFDTADERRDWYDNGYSAVRKGRFWSFGSSSEVRGGAIAYWQPNYLRRAESNYHDISVYGSSEEKWAHSWLPTPTHPLSTIRAALNPYWLEKKHLKEGDRPYPLTSKMFTEGTPWGAVLNPTIGEILKPVRMLPEARLRLGRNGRDAKSVINRINERIQRKEQTNDNLLIVSGTDIRNAEYVPFGNPTAGEANVSMRGGNAQILGTDFMTDMVPNLADYAPPTGEDYVQQTRNMNSRVLIRKEDEQIIDSKILDGMTNGGTPGQAETIGRSIISKINRGILKHEQGNMPKRNVGVMNDSSNSTYIYRNLTNEYNKYLDNWYGERNDPQMINRSLKYDFMRDAMYSTSQISGIYGYLGGMLTGSDNSYTFRYESAEQMNSFSRSFWDASIGGIGAGPMEIARRFFPSEQRNRINVNPLINNMPDWIPDSYKTGDPYTNIPKGEARLPGKGYESLNDLHPDMFGDYGAFDRYKILADIAPNSREYKKWRNIAKATVTDEGLVEEMKQIAERTAKMSGNHEFFEYKYMRNNTIYSKGVVQSVSNGMITLTDNSVISLAGIVANDSTNSAMSSMLQAGTEITYRHDKNRVYNKEDINKNFATAAVVYAGSGESLNKSLIDSGAAEKDVEDNSTIASLGRISSMQEASGAIQEFIAHAPIPIFHNKFLRVDSAYESYLKENYYGSNFKTWDHPIKGFVKPMFNEQSGKSLAAEALSLGIAYRHFTTSVHSSKASERWASNILLATTNPTAFLGGNISYILHMSNGGKGRGQELTNWQKGAEIGTIIGTAKYAWDNADNPFKSMTGMAMAGATIASKDIGWELLEKYIGKMSVGKGMAIGAGVGLAMSAIKNPDFDKEKLFGRWAPKETYKKWELDEYFDRLEYMKYSGLYEKAAKKARRKEKVDVEGIFKQIGKNKKEITKLNLKAAKLMSKNISADKYKQQLQEIEQRKMTLEEQSTMMFEGGEYTRSAIAYKKAMESTMYGLDATATRDELLAAVPDQYKDHFQAFMDVTDKKEQKKILKSVSPMMRRPLQAAWGMKLDRPASNKRYFNVHAMPGPGWRGWRPNVNLKYVKMKTIENEGMLLSDFGYYESEKSKVTFEDAPDIRHYDRGNPLNNMAIKSVMKGRGLAVHNVSVERTRAPGISIIGDVKEKAEDYKKAGGYEISKMAYHLGSLF